MKAVNIINKSHFFNCCSQSDEDTVAKQLSLSELVKHNFGCPCGRPELMGHHHGWAPFRLGLLERVGPWFIFSVCDLPAFGHCSCVGAEGEEHPWAFFLQFSLLSMPWTVHPRACWAWSLFSEVTQSIQELFQGDFNISILRCVLEIRLFSWLCSEKNSVSRVLLYEPRLGDVNGGTAIDFSNFQRLPFNGFELQPVRHKLNISLFTLDVYGI